MKKLAQVRRQATIQITGALRTTPTLLLDPLADIPPFHTTVKLLLLNDTIRLATLPKSLPLHPFITQASRRYIKRHRAPLHELLHTFDINPTKIEKITPF